MTLERRKEFKPAARTGKRVRAIALITALLIAPAYGQQIRFDLEAITAGGDYQVGMARKEGVQSVSGYGGGVSARFRILEQVAVQVGVGYGQFNITETDPITKWDWEYWKRLYRNHVVSLLGDSAYFNGRLETLRNISAERLTAGRWVGKDSLYSVQLTPVEYMNIIPVNLALTFTAPLLENVRIDASIGTTLLVFERNLYLDESWTKRRVPDVGSDSGNVYVFSYGYRNFAPPKEGRGVGIGGGLSVQWNVISNLSIQIGGRFETYDLVRTSSFEFLPFRQRLLIGAALSLYY